MPIRAHQHLVVSRAAIRYGVADLVTLIPWRRAERITWSVRTQNGAPALLSLHGNPGLFVGIAPGLYTVNASVDGERKTATILVYGNAVGVTLTPISSTVSRERPFDAIEARVVDSMGNTVANFKGVIAVNAVAGVTYRQNGRTLRARKGTVSIVIAHGRARFNVGGMSNGGVSIAVTGSALSSSHGNAIDGTPTYATTIIRSCGYAC